MKKYFGMEGQSLSYAISVIAGLDFLLFGYDQGVMGGLLEMRSFGLQFPKINPYQWQCDTADISNPTHDQKYSCTSTPFGQMPSLSKYQEYSTYQGIAVAGYNLGCFIGAVLTIWIGNRLGRKRTIFLGSIIMTIGAILQCSSFSTSQFIFGRIFTGIGNGINTSTVPTWQSETAKAHARGPLVMIEGSLIALGITISYWIDFGFQFIGDQSVAWRFPLAFQIVFCLIILTFILGLPESPRWLILKGRDEEALEVLAVLNKADKNDEFVQNEFKAAKATVEEMSKGSFRDLFTMGKERHFHRTVLAYVNQMFQQISGINLITYYAPVIYGTVGLTGYLPSLLAACNGIEYFLASLLPIFIVEKVGRRTLMLVGAAGMSISMAVLAISNSFADNGNSQAGIAAAVFLFVFNTFFAWGWLGMTWLYPAEIVPLRIRAPANALSTSANWIFNFMVVMITPPAFANIGYQTYIIFAVINAFMFPVTYFFFPETRGRSLEEVDEIFEKSTVLGVVGVAAREPHRYDTKGNLVDAEARGGVQEKSLTPDTGSGTESDKEADKLAGESVQKAHVEAKPF